MRVQATQVETPSSSTRAAAAYAAPPASEKPNFWSSCAVAMYSWVCASTPTVTRISTGGRTPRSRASAVSRSISSNESTMIRPTPTSSARLSSSSDLLLPWNPIRAGSIPAASATANSPPEQTSRFSPSSAMTRTTALHRKALPA